MNAIKFIIILTFLAMVAACSLPISVVDESPIEYDVNRLNQQISLQAPNEWNDFIVGNPVGLFLTLNIQLVDGEVVFPYDFGLRIFYKQSGQWIEVQQEPIIRPMDEVVLSRIGKTSRSVVFYPDLPDRIQKYEMRAYVFGDMRMPDGGIQQVSAFADFTLVP